MEPFALPCGEGLLLGRLREVGPATTFNEGCRSDRVAYYQTQVDVEGTLAAKRDGRFVDSRGFVGVTYVGPDEMRPHQVLYRRRLVEINRRFGPYAEISRRAFDGATVDAATTGGVDREDGAGFEGLDEVARAASDLERLMGEPETLLAMGG